MYKRIVKNKAYFAIGWSKVHQYDRHSASRILPDLPGIILFTDRKSDSCVLMFASWREGVRTAMQVLMDPILSKNRFLMEQLKERRLNYRYCIIDSSPADLQDIFAKLLRDYDPELNDSAGVKNSGRFKEVTVHEVNTDDPTGKFGAPAFFKHR